MSITVSISAVQTHAPDVDADEMSNSRRSPLSLMPPICRTLWASTTLAVESLANTLGAQTDSVNFVIINKLS